MQRMRTLIAFYLVLSSVFPPMHALPGYTALGFVAMAAWVLLAGLSHPALFTIFSKNPIHTQVMIFFVTYTFLIPYLFGNGTIGNRYLSYAQLLVFYLIYKYNKTYGYSKSSESIIKWSIPFILYTSVVTMVGLINNPFLSRSIKSSGEYSQSLQAQGIGGYSFIYFLVFVIIMILFLVINSKVLKINFSKKVIGFSILAILMTTLFLANYFTGLAIVGIGLFILFITTKLSAISRVFIGLASIIILLIAKPLFLNVTNWLILNLKDGKNAVRIYELQTNILYPGAEDTILSGRLPVLESSWNAFLENPFFGMISGNLNYSGGHLIGFGQHSQILDTFALYGFVIGLIHVYIIVQPFLVRFKGRRELFSLNLALMVSVLSLFFMNNATPSIGYAVFFIYPVIYDWVDSRLGEGKTVENLGKPVSHGVATTS